MCTQPCDFVVAVVTFIVSLDDDAMPVVLTVITYVVPLVKFSNVMWFIVTLVLTCVPLGYNRSTR